MTSTTKIFLLKYTHTYTQTNRQTFRHIYTYDDINMIQKFTIVDITHRVLRHVALVCGY